MVPPPCFRGPGRIRTVDLRVVSAASSPLDDRPGVARFLHGQVGVGRDAVVGPMPDPHSEAVRALTHDRTRKIRLTDGDEFLTTNQEDGVPDADPRIGIHHSGPEEVSLEVYSRVHRHDVPGRAQDSIPPGHREMEQAAFFSPAGEVEPMAVRQSLEPGSPRESDRRNEQTVGGVGAELHTGECAELFANDCQGPSGRGHGSR